MLSSAYYHMPTWVSLVVIVVVLGGAVALSLLFPKAEPAADDGTLKVTVAPSKSH
jgi:hypothetical protein